MTVARKAQRLAAAVRAAMPEARVSIDHSRTSFGESSYVHVIFGRGGAAVYAKARVSDHGIGQRRYAQDTCSLYLAAGSKPEAWAVWLGDLVRRYADQGGRLPPAAPLFEEPRAGAILER